MAEKKGINGKAVPMEDYGSLGKAGDKVHIMGDQDETSTSMDEGLHMNAPSTSQYEPGSDIFFSDNKRRIDYMLAFEEPLVSNKAKDEKHAQWRQKFMKSLRKVGLQMEEENVQNEKTLINFIKLHAPWSVLCEWAEHLSMRAPLQAHPNPSNDWSGKLLAKLKVPNIMYQEVPNTPLDYYTCAFKKSKMERFLGIENKETFFNPRDRSRVVYEILASAPYGKRKRAEIGIDRLLEEEIYSAAYPIHDGEFETPPGQYSAPEALNPRQILYEYWARWGRWYKYQPLDHIREYFGEKIGIYFAWLGFYTAWLLPASLVGVLVFLYGVLTISWNIPAKEVCNSGEDFKMCPLCDEDIGCEFWYLSDVCLFIKISYLFDHPGTVFYAVFIAFWAVTFLEYWKRKTASLAHHWDCLDFEEEEERPRPQYAAMAPLREINPITGISEPYFPDEKRLPRILSGMAMIIIMIVLVLIFIVAVIMYRVLISIPLFQSKTLRPNAATIASMTAAVVNLILIMALGKVYEKLALKLTLWEMHRTQTEFEDQLTFKVFIFQFVNFYSSIVYIAFFKGKFVGYPGNYTRFFGLRNEECNAGGCLVELAQQLGVIMIGKQMINNAQEVIVPKFKTWLRKRKVKLGNNVAKTRWEEDYQLIDYEGLFQEYLEMVLQFGFITIFVAAFPLAPLFALLNNWVEIRLDAQKLVCETRKPVGERAQDIGVWFTILEALASMAVISNAFLIAFTSEFLPRLLYQYERDFNLWGYTNFSLAWAPNGTLTEPCRYRAFRDENGDYTLFYWRLFAVRLGFVILFEHIVFGINRLIDILVPDVPQALEVKIKRERYLAKQALADTNTVFGITKPSDKEDASPDDVTVRIEGK
ncbi:anoctamin-7-like [Liolophura sinensis]|uniref:anoctamin-7-like n=1 Tax=Liolophura sinensis TaxID=3198878 RepID=UPI0031592F58